MGRQPARAGRSSEPAQGSRARMHRGGDRQLDRLRDRPVSRAGLVPWEPPLGTGRTRACRPPRRAWLRSDHGSDVGQGQAAALAQASLIPRKYESARYLWFQALEDSGDAPGVSGASISTKVPSPSSTVNQRYWVRRSVRTTSSQYLDWVVPSPGSEASERGTISAAYRTTTQLRAARSPAAEDIFTT